MSLKAFVLCAGEGIRFRPHSAYLPKVLLPFLNIPLISYNLYLLKILGVTHFAANSYQHSLLIKNKLEQQAQLMDFKTPVLSYESTLLGSAGGLWKLKDFFSNQDHFLYLNGDSFIWPQQLDSLKNFYSKHVKSNALASFLVKPTHKIKEVIWADDSYRINSFLKKPENKNSIKAYDFSGLALFSSRIFKEIPFSSADHIFKDVLEPCVYEKYFRVHSIPSLKLLDMNQETTYLKNTKQVLEALINKTIPFVSQTLNLCSPKWNCFKGENYFSADKIKNPPQKKSDILFCGSRVKNREKLLVKNFAVLGNDVSLMSDLYIDSGVIGEQIKLNKNVKNEFIIKVL